MKPAFSTVACPDWTLERVAELAGRVGALGVELRTFGDGSTQIACEPFLTSPRKTAALFDEQGVEIACVATSARFDRPVEPPLIGQIIGDNDRPVRDTKAAVKLAEQISAPFVRVFGFELHGGENRKRGITRIVDRLQLAVATARNTEVRIVLENGGSFGTAAEISELIDRVNSPLLTAAYSIPAAIAAGEDPVSGINVLGERLAIVKVKALDHGLPCALGQGDAELTRVQQNAIHRLAEVGFGGWVVYEHDRVWLGTGDDGETVVPVDEVIASSIRTLYDWIGPKAVTSPRVRKAVRAGGAWRAGAASH